MKLSLILFFCAVLQVSAGNLFSQGKTISLDMKNKSAREVIKEIESQSEMNFFYNDDLDNLNKLINVNLSSEDFQSALESTLAQAELTYQVINDQFIVLIPAETSASKQPEQISGKVTDTDGQALIGVNIVVVGSSIGAISNVDGTYKIDLPDRNSVLRFTYIGYETQEVLVGNQTVINLTLEPSAVGINEVVITALGIKVDKKALGYATGEVGGDEITSSKTSNFANALAGKVAGVNVTQSSGQAGGGSRIVIRGGSSITGNNQPLVVVDGVQYDASNTLQSSGYADLDPSSIESVSVLKGAAASAIYGSAAANGVLLITTKRGQFNAPISVSVSHSSTFQRVIEHELQTSWSQGYSDNGVYTYDETVRNSWGPRIEDVPGAQMNDRWDIFETGYTAESSVNVSGGTEKATFYLGYQNYANSGMLKPQQSYNRNVVTANTSYKFSDKFTVTAGFSYTNSEQNRVREGYRSMFDYFLHMPNTWDPYPVYDETGWLRAYRGGRDPYLWTLENEQRNIVRDRFFGNVTLEYKITPNLTFRSVSGASTLNNQHEDTHNRDGYRSPAGYYKTQTQFSRDYESTNMLTYNKQLGDFNVNVMAGHYIQSKNYTRWNFNGQGLSVPGLYNTANVSSYTADYELWDYRIWSMFAEARIGWKSLIYYSISGRNDWASTLKDDYFYPSHSLSFVFSELLDHKHILSFGKLRASYAKVGSPATPYQTNTAMSAPESNGVVWPFNGMVSYLSSSAYPNENLVNEFKKEIEVGADLRFFKDRLSVDVSLYKMWSENQILWQNLLSSAGATGGYINIGEIEHKGIELMVSGTPIRTKDFSWDIIVSYAKDKSMVNKLGFDDRPIEVGSGYWFGARAAVGYPYPLHWGKGYLEDDQGRLVLDDTDPSAAGYGRPLREQESRNLGVAAPDWMGSLMNTFSYKGFSLFAQLDIRSGGYIFNEDTDYIQQGMAAETEDRPEDDRITFDGVMGHWDSSLGKVVVSSETPQSTSYSGFFPLYYDIEVDNVQPSGFIKLREVTLSYSVPTSKLSNSFVKRVNVYATGRNLWRKFDDGYTGTDPENVATDGDDPWNVDNGSAKQSFIFPGSWQLSIGVNLTF